MPERLILLDERYSHFKPASPEVSSFTKGNPQANSELSLAFLLENFPQRDKGGIIWLAEGSKAIELYHPGKLIPNDIDILTSRDDFADKFGLPPGLFDVRTSKFWLEARGYKTSKENLDYLMTAYMARSFGGRKVLVSAPNVLGLSKKKPYNGHPPRPKDILHLAILAEAPTNVKQKHIDRTDRRFLNAY